MIKRAFSLVEVLFSIIILGIIFSFFYLSYAQIIKNSQNLHLHSLIKQNEMQLYNKQAKLSDTKIKTNIQDFILFELLTQDIQLQSLKPKNQDYEVFFKDEKSF
ncbi:hypothetical protein DMB92_00865 [Campylobacter sp. MIT 99-7217]|uniref:type II secretion system protein n=1 Tax=Campylobacter sp. MIT 99-7217 TaxID=535091 RepID=UPI0011595ECE|nr:type II secretion system protein [Campylobacter sp. MIT 99-7217]TQR34548.1 hypothetical protein DMB92_00865 [Campylobacter sp. MIT 99-7217]